MGNKDIIQTAAKIRKALNNQITPERIMRYLRGIGFSVEFYDKDGDTLKRHNLHQHIEYSKEVDAFTYNNDDRKIVFISENLPEETILHSLIHELAHIELGHLKKMKNLRNLHKEEMEAEALTYFVLNLTKQNYKAVCVLGAMALTVGAIAGSVIVKLRN